jgi:hypothetical protein
MIFGNDTLSEAAKLMRPKRKAPAVGLWNGRGMEWDLR